jgi:hypothetical protein
LTVIGFAVYITNAMPNQRAKNKALIGAFVDAQLKLAVAKFARQKGITSSDVLSEALKQYLERNENPTSVSATTVAAESQAARSTIQEDDRDEAKEVWLL